VNGRALNFLGLALVGVIGIAFMILTPRFAELDAVLETHRLHGDGDSRAQPGADLGLWRHSLLRQSAFFGLGAYAYAIAMFNLGESTIPDLAGDCAAGGVRRAARLFHVLWPHQRRLSRRHHADGDIDPVQFGQFHRRSGNFHIGTARLGGFNGIPGIPRSPSRRQDGGDRSGGMFYLATGSLLVTYFGLRLLLASRFGRIIVGIRENERRAELLGYDPRAYKLATFTIGGALAGLPAACFANWGNFVSPTIFGLFRNPRRSSSGFWSAAAAR